MADTYPIFRTWTFDEIPFLAVPHPQDGVWHIMDMFGRNYGAWSSVKNFRHYQKERMDCAQPLGTASVRTQLAEKYSRDDWRQIKGHPRYAINPWGDVRFPSGRIKRAEDRKRPAAKDAYLLVGMEGRCYAIHILVARAFLPPKPEVGPDGYEIECDHIDGDKCNSFAGNLRWLTNSQNVREGIVRRKGYKGMWILGIASRTQIAECIILLNRGESIGDTSEYVGVSKNLVQGIRSRHWFKTTCARVILGEDAAQWASRVLVRGSPARWCRKLADGRVVLPGT